MKTTTRTASSTPRSFNGTNTTDPSKSLTMRAAFTATVNANGVLVVNNQAVTCQ
ncbi:hypothetical protein [Arthrobacter bambusae]|uniref:hypothetical protein n=1 Tax=Arthrobacter bambusae TaxID=1338426 RepID=UPI0027855F37|nr:hypothetical protein [Arthrobacter bambusae]MDQ0213122.1 hypothetical protein [Arthrobacter bambusae]MDQ0237428.1 hypothetical protein [Arthrobacter bambusae]